jgi:Icc-related predicted phosphoesterase
MIAATADLHGFLPEVPPCDLLLIAGDLCGPSAIERQFVWLKSTFAKWLLEVPAVEVVGIAGNHDWIFEKAPDRVPDLRWHYLQDSGIELFGLKIYGTPWQPRFCDWAFNLDEPELDRWFAKIPDDTDILLTHGPALGLGGLCIDDHEAGSPSLLKHLERVQPRLHLCGHIHEGYGEYRVGKTISANVSYVDVNYRPVNRVMTWEI